MVKALAPTVFPPLEGLNVHKLFYNFVRKHPSLHPPKWRSIPAGPSLRNAVETRGVEVEKVAKYAKEGAERAHRLR